MGGNNKICILHTDIRRGITDLNKDAGKLFEQLARIKENIPWISRIFETVKGYILK